MLARRAKKKAPTLGLGAETALACLCLGALALSPHVARAQSSVEPPPVTDAQRQGMEQQLQDLLIMRQEFDRRISKLEVELRGASTLPPPSNESAILAIPPQEIAASPPPAKWGSYEYPKGFVMVRSDLGELTLGAVGYARYLNQLGLDDTATNAFGDVTQLDLRQDMQLAKVQLTFKGWVLDPKFGYNLYFWTSNTSQGQGAQVVGAGNLNYTFNDALKVYAGVHSLPSTRSTNRTFPNWLRNDNRPIADEFFRGSYTQGFWAEGRIAPGLEYRAMIANNLSALGVNAGQLDDQFDTISGALTWMPTTGEFGPGAGFGDFEHHTSLATLFSAHYTQSTETPQSQPGTESIENTQLRLSDGTLLFKVDAFHTPGRITEARYQMFAANAALKYRGYSLEFEYYNRRLDEFKVEGIIPVTDLSDSGFQLQASAMLIPKKLQLYVSGSKIFGEYGDPYDIGAGFNWFPMGRKEFRISTMGLYVDRSPVGYTAYPLPVGAKGFTFITDFSLAF